MRVTALSKDGWEKDINRGDSKRNLFYFIQHNVISEFDRKGNFEDLFWEKTTRKVAKQMKNRYERFLLNQANEIDKDFEYEGLFDQKEKKSTKNIGDRSRIDISNIMGQLSKSRLGDESNMLNKHEKNSIHSFMSKNSDNKKNVGLSFVRKYIKLHNFSTTITLFRGTNQDL